MISNNDNTFTTVDLYALSVIEQICGRQLCTDMLTSISSYDMFICEERIIDCNNDYVFEMVQKILQRLSCRMKLLRLGTKDIFAFRLVRLYTFVDPGQLAMTVVHQTALPSPGSYDLSSR